MKKFILLYFLILIFISFTLAQKVEIIHSDKAEIIFKDGKEDKVILKDNVNLRYLKQNLKSNLVIFDKAKGRVYSDENVELTGYGITLNSKKFNIDINTNDLILIDNEGFYNPWYVKAKEIRVINNEEYILRKGFLTSCDSKEPHYKLTFSKIKFIREKKMKVTNSVFYIWRIPLFYIPY